MKPIAIVTDSNSGITQKQAEGLGITVIPMPFMIEDDTYFEDITLSQKEFYEKLKSDVAISTSQPSPEYVMNEWNRLLKEYEAIIHIPMSSGLSSSCATAYMLAQEYQGRVFVVDNQRISVTQKGSVMDALRMVEKGLSAQEIYDHLMENAPLSSIYIMVDTLKYLKRGGRVTPAAAALGTLLRLKPVLQIHGQKLDAFAKARTVNQARQIMIKQILKDCEESYGKNVHVSIAHTENPEEAASLREELQQYFPDNDIDIDPLSLSVSCHIGPGALAIAVTKNLEV